ncbi:MAG TPA: polyprenol monophosphomannose synthase [Candidatus Dormibacteraeota bacterium]
MPLRTLVILPTYNERDNLPRLLEAILKIGPGLDALVVDDNSPDGTGDQADELASRDSRIKVLHRAGKQGLGRAYVAGFDYALRHAYEYVIEMDADFSHRPEDLPALLSAAAHADVVIGSRNIPGGTTIGWSRVRRFVSRGGSLYTRMILRLPIKDCTSGFKCLSRSALGHLDLEQLLSNGYAFQVEVSHALHQAGLRFAEVPITFPERVAGRSKMTPGIMFEAAILVIRLRLGLARPALAPKALAQKAS